MIRNIEVIDSSILDEYGESLLNIEFEASVSIYGDMNISYASIFIAGRYAPFSLINDNQQTQFKIIDSIPDKEVVIERDNSQTGYCIVPKSSIDKKLLDDIDESITISGKQIISMSASAMIAINNGDTNSRSLNAKLYSCIAEFAHEEIKELVKDES